MATRKTGISPEHVKALNLVEVDFYGLKSVENAWREYKKLLNTNPDLDASWSEHKEKLLADLLYQMAIHLNFKIPALEIFKGGYSPGGWEHKENMQNGVLDYINDVANGKKIIPVYIVGSNPTMYEKKTDV